MNPLSIQYLSMDENLEDGSISKEWILAGSPQVSSKVLSISADELSFIVLWECSAGKFRWDYHFDETLYLIDGAVTIEDPSGASRTLSKGDVVFFPKGATAIWTVHGHIRKLAICRRAFPPLVGAVIKLLRSLKAVLHGESLGVPLGPSPSAASISSDHVSKGA